MHAIFGEKHMLGAAETDPLGSEKARLLGIARNVGVRANAEVAAELVRPLHEGGEVVRLRIRLVGLALAQINFAERAVKRDPVALFEDQFLTFEENRGLLFASSTAIDDAPTTQGRPMPRATTAA